MSDDPQQLLDFAVTGGRLAGNLNGDSIEGRSNGSHLEFHRIAPPAGFDQDLMRSRNALAPVMQNCVDISRWLVSVVSHYVTSAVQQELSDATVRMSEGIAKRADSAEMTGAYHQWRGALAHLQTMSDTTPALRSDPDVSRSMRELNQHEIPQLMIS